MITPTLLALDMSSVAIGYVVRNGHVLAHGTIELNAKQDIAQRGLAACQAVQGLLDEHPEIDAIAIESPVAKFAKSIIPQARLSGAVLVLVQRAGYLWLEISPTEGKRALCQDGTATKHELLKAAAPYFGYSPEALTYAEKRGKWGAWDVSGLVYGEDAADALGLALAGQSKVKVQL